MPAFYLKIILSSEIGEWLIMLCAAEIVGLLKVLNRRQDNFLSHSLNTIVRGAF